MSGLPKIFNFIWLTVLLAFCLPNWGYAESELIETGASKEIGALIAGKRHPYLRQADFSNRADDLQALYKSVNNQLLWVGKDNSAKTIADALDLLAKASVQGLNQDNYDLTALRNKYPSVLKIESEAYHELALYDTALSVAMLRFLHDLHYGRVNPHGINYKLQLREKKLTDLPALIKDSITLNTIPQLPILVEPKLHQYQKLKAALASYQAMAAEGKSFQFNVKGKLRPGQHHAQLAELSQFLVSVGDLPKDKVVTAENGAKLRYDADLTDAVKNFQSRHGIPANGVIGQDTVNAVNTPVLERIRQIELAMERLRWLPELTNIGRLIVVNIPAYQLWAIDNLGQVVPDIMNMRVVVGKALKNQTPVLMANMSFIEFLPYWNVPSNILKEEVLPKLIKKPGFLNSQNMEVVGGYSPSAKSMPVNAQTIEKLKKGVYRVRQRPGKGNSLGKVKFIFPNKDDVYLHDTPANSLFSRTRRDFSHGCVRVEHPAKLAEFALKNQGKWSPESIKKAMQGKNNQRVDLKNPIPVLFFYTTAFVDEKNNLGFYPDIYGHDKVLLEALKKTDDLSDQSIFVTTTETPPPINSTP